MGLKREMFPPILMVVRRDGRWVAVDSQDELEHGEQVCVYEAKRLRVMNVVVSRHLEVIPE